MQVQGDSGRQGRCTGELLRLLEGPYRPVWVRVVSRAHGDQINFSAVAKVLARAAEIDRPDGVHHRELRDRVRRALAHGQVTNATLDLFIRAFGIRRADAGRLWALLLDIPVAPEVPEPRTPLRDESSETSGR